MKRHREATSGTRYGDLGHCPKCGKFCSLVFAEARGEVITSVYGTCKIHGQVDLTKQDWSWEDFFPDDPTPTDPSSRTLVCFPTKEIA